MTKVCNSCFADFASLRSWFKKSSFPIAVTCCEDKKTDLGWIYKLNLIFWREKRGERESGEGGLPNRHWRGFLGVYWIPKKNCGVWRSVKWDLFSCSLSTILTILQSFFYLSNVFIKYISLIKLFFKVLKNSVFHYKQCNRDCGTTLRWGGGGAPLVTQYWGGHKTLFLTNS